MFQWKYPLWYAETLWSCDGIELEDVIAKGDYLAMNSKNMVLRDFRLAGNYSFDGAKNVEIHHARVRLREQGYAEETTDVCCAVVWYPATDLSETMRTVQTGEYTGFRADFAWSNIERYVGKTIQDVGDESLMKASPIHYISENMPPVLLQHGNADTICPVDQSWRFYHAAATAAGEGKVAIDILEGAEHGDQTFETETNMAVVKAFLDEYLNHSASME